MPYFEKNTISSVARERVILSCILVVLFMIYSTWACNLPMDMSPDEHMRIKVPLYILEHGCLPLGWDTEIRDALWGTSYGFSVYGSSLFALPFMTFAKITIGTEASLVIAARISGCVLACGSIICIYEIARELGFTFSRRLIAVIFFALLPQFVFLTAYFNSEQLELFSISLVVLCLLKGCKNNWHFSDCAKLGVALGILVLSYYFAYGAILASIVYYYGTVHGKRRCGVIVEPAWKSYLVKPLVVFLAASVIAGWFFVRNFLLYSGDFIGMSTSSMTSERYATEGFKPSQRITAASMGLSPLSLFDGSYNGSNWAIGVLDSFVGNFGYLTIYVGNTTRNIILGILLLGVVFAVVALLRFPKKNQLFVVSLMSVLFIVVTPIALSVYYSWASDYQAQGRYLISFWPIISIVAAYGWDAASSCLSDVCCRRGVLYPEEPRAQVCCLVRKIAALVPYVAVAVYIAVFIRVFYNLIVPYCFGSVL